MESVSDEIPGFYVAHHRWFDFEEGVDSLYKVGHTGDLGRRLLDGAYVTCFSGAFDFVWTFETGSKADAERLEAGVLFCTQNRRVCRANGIRSELVKASRVEIEELATKVAQRLSIEGQIRDSRVALVAYPSSIGGTAKAASPDTSGDSGTRCGAEVLPSDGFSIEDPRSYPNRSNDLAALRGLELGEPDACATVGVEPDCSKRPRKHEPQYADSDAEFADEFDLDSEANWSGVDSVSGASDHDWCGPEGEPLVLEDRQYQSDAIAACLRDLDRGSGRTVLQMACRCGKTRVAHGVIHGILSSPSSDTRPDATRKHGGTISVGRDTSEGHARAHTSHPIRILYLVPGLALLRQTAQKLDRYGFGGAHVRALLVGSDGRPLRGLTSLVSHEGNPTLLGTTNLEEIERVCGSPSAAPLLVISTYQSSGLLRDVFDLTVFDETHRVCGPATSRPFNHVLLKHTHGKRLYMTATPRYDSPLSMKDRDLFGGVAFAYHMRRGIDAGYVNAFSLELIGEVSDVSSAAYAALSDPTHRLRSEDHPAAARATGSAGRSNASAQQILTGLNMLLADQPNGKLLVFCRNIKHASALRKETEVLYSRLAGEPRAHEAEGDSASPVEFFEAHSRMSRAEISSNLAMFCRPDKAGVLFNCRLFQEGVEIPTLNGVFFASPRHSPRDIIQSLCRPLNVLPGKPPSRIFIPVRLSGAQARDEKNEVSPETFGAFASVVPYFDALMAEDPLLYEHLLDPKGVTYPLHWVNSAAQVNMRYDPDRLLATARRVVRRGRSGKVERLLRAARIPWELGFTELRRIVEECGRYPKTTDCYQYSPGARINFNAFYRYARESYSKWKAGKPQPLEPFQLRQLESLPGWEPYGVEGPYPWRQSLNFLERWLEENEGVPPPVNVSNGGYIGLEATDMERLSGVLTCVNQSDGRDRKSRGASKPGSGLTLEAEKQKDLDELCARWGLRWRKDRSPALAGSVVGSLIEDSKGAYAGRRTFIQDAYGRFKQIQKTQGNNSEFIQKWYPQYPTKHKRMERADVWARRKTIVPPRWRKVSEKRSRRTKTVELGAL